MYKILTEATKITPSSQAPLPLLTKVPLPKERLVVTVAFVCENRLGQIRTVEDACPYNVRPSLFTDVGETKAFPLRGRCHGISRDG